MLMKIHNFYYIYLLLAKFKFIKNLKTKFKGIKTFDYN